MLVQARQEPGDLNRAFLNLISGLFIVLGMAALIWLVLSVFNDPAIQEASASGDSGKTILAFLDNFGILLPIIVVAVSLYLLRLGTRLLQRDINAATWARQILLWLLIVAAYLGVQTILGLMSGSADPARAIIMLIAVIVFGGAVFFGYQWLNNNEAQFIGMESLSSRTSRVAWNLLVPTIIILIFVAARPLEQTFIASLTDERFASSRETNFVGLDNYAQLLGVRVDVIPPCAEGGEIAGCPETLDVDENGNPVVTFPRARNYLGEGYADAQFRELSVLTIGGSQVLLSARDRDFIESVGNTLYFTFFSVILELILGLFIAMVINSKFTGRGLMRAAMLVPWAIPTVISARLWEVMLRDNESGLINLLYVRLFGGARSIAWLASPEWQLPALIAVDVWKTTPFMALILLAGLQVIPTEIYEAADVDGANKPRQFLSLTLPLLRPTIAVALIFRTLDAIRAFDVFQVLLGRSKLSMATYNYEQLIQSQQFGYASAVGVVIFMIILVFTIIYIRALGVETE
jgi:trehalose/maltose transport system permease protein